MGKSLILNVAIIGFLFIALYFLTQNSEAIRSLAKTPQRLIAGVSTNVKEEKETLPEELVKDAKIQFEGVKKNTLNLTVDEIITFFSKSGKIVDDLRNVQKSVDEFISR